MIYAADFGWRGNERRGRSRPATSGVMRLWVVGLLDLQDLQDLKRGFQTSVELHDLTPFPL
jgi:hypothetical protein